MSFNVIGSNLPNKWSEFKDSVADLFNRAVDKQDDTMEGDLILEHDPTQTMEAATKNYVDTHKAPWRTDGDLDSIYLGRGFKGNDFMYCSPKSTTVDGVVTHDIKMINSGSIQMILRISDVSKVVDPILKVYYKGVLVQAYSDNSIHTLDISVEEGDIIRLEMRCKYRSSGTQYGLTLHDFDILANPDTPYKYNTIF